MPVSERNLMGLNVRSKDGVVLGEVVGLKIQTSGWTVKAFEVSISGSVLKQLNMRRPAFGSRTVEIAVAAVARVDSHLDLSRTVEELAKTSDTDIPSPYRVQE